MHGLKEIISLNEVAAAESKRTRKRTKGKLRLFVWTDFSPDYTGGLAFAVARTEAQARELVARDNVLELREWGDLHIRQLAEGVVYSVSGGG